MRPAAPKRASTLRAAWDCAAARRQTHAYYTCLVPLPASQTHHSETMTLRRLAIHISLLLAAAAFAAQSKMTAAPRVEFIPWEEAAPIVTAAPAGTLPPELAGKQPQQLIDLWP